MFRSQMLLTLIMLTLIIEMHYLELLIEINLIKLDKDKISNDGKLKFNG